MKDAILIIAVYDKVNIFYILKADFDDVFLAIQVNDPAHMSRGVLGNSPTLFYIKSQNASEFESITHIPS